MWYLLESTFLFHGNSSESDDFTEWFGGHERMTQFCKQSIEIGTGIKIWDMGQPKILAALIQVLLRNETIKFCVDIQNSVH